ncbi:MAG: methylated-DNA--[protein]-cysteine S-methyltransferase [Candidatus Bathyarchaeota archaeon]|nr:methylated-DNA--[protein]-cysteine S-methyltransferase [Candidatus Bathyarchaeota archaeon]
MIGLYAKNVGGVWFGVACDEHRVFSTSFADSEQDALRCLLSGIPFNVPFQVFQAPSAFAENVLAAMKNVYDGNGIPHALCLAMEHLPEYTRKVLEATSLIPLGYVSSYGAIAQAVGGSPRAVGNVMAKNPLAPIIPCHRVVSADFTLGGYGGGSAMKLGLLKREKRGYTSPWRITACGINLQVFPVEFVLRKLERAP